MSLLWKYFPSLPWHSSHISSHQCRCQCAQIALPSNGFWAVNGSYGNHCCHFSFIRRAPSGTMETRCDTKKSTSKPVYTVIRIYWNLLKSSQSEKVHAVEPLDSVPYLPLNIVQCIKPWYYIIQKWMYSFVSLLLQIGILHLCIPVLLYVKQ